MILVDVRVLYCQNIDEQPGRQFFDREKNKRKKLFTSFDRKSASSINKRQFYHTNFVFINAKFINKSEIKSLSYAKLRQFDFKIPKG